MIDSLIATGADVVAVACPFCIQMVEDGIPAVQPDAARRLKAFDISELLEVAVVDRPRAHREAAGTSGDDERRTDITETPHQQASLPLIVAGRKS